MSNVRANLMSQSNNLVDTTSIPAEAENASDTSLSSSPAGAPSAQTNDTTVATPTETPAVETPKSAEVKQAEENTENKLEGAKKEKKAATGLTIVGSALAACSVIPFVGWVLGLVGAVCIGAGQATKAGAETKEKKANQALEDTKQKEVEKQAENAEREKQANASTANLTSSRSSSSSNHALATLVQTQRTASENDNRPEAA